MGADYRGEPLFSVPGQVLQFDSTALSGAPIRVSLFWSPAGETDAATQGLLEQTSVSVAVSFPAAFALHVFEPPEPRFRTSDGLGFATIRVYQDTNRDGRYSEGELVGGAEERAVVWSAAPVAAGESPTREALSAGFQLVRLPAPCGSSTCALPLDAACTVDEDCGGGVCLHDPSGGSCVFPSSGVSCVPTGAVALYVDALDDVVFAKACTAAGDCRASCRPELGACWAGDCQCTEDALFCDCEPEPTPLGKACANDSDCDVGVCDGSLGVCLPELPVQLVIDPNFAVAPLCASP